MDIELATKRYLFWDFNKKRVIAQVLVNRAWHDAYVPYDDFEDLAWSHDQRLAHYERLMLKYGRLMDELQAEMKTEAG